MLDTVIPLGIAAHFSLGFTYVMRGTQSEILVGFAGPCCLLWAAFKTSMPIRAKMIGGAGKEIGASGFLWAASS